MGLLDGLRHQLIDIIEWLDNSADTMAWRFPRGDNEFRIRFLDQECPRPDDDADSLCDRVHRRMAQELERLDAGTVWEKAAVQS